MEFFFSLPDIHTSLPDEIFHVFSICDVYYMIFLSLLFPQAFIFLSSMVIVGAIKRFYTQCAVLLSVASFFFT
jgi:hypothetical protein